MVSEAREIFSEYIGPLLYHSWCALQDASTYSKGSQRSVDVCLFVSVRMHTPHYHSTTAHDRHIIRLSTRITGIGYYRLTPSGLGCHLAAYATYSHAQICIAAVLCTVRLVCKPMLGGSVYNLAECSTVIRSGHSPEHSPTRGSTVARYLHYASDLCREICSTRRRRRTCTPRRL